MPVLLFVLLLACKLYARQLLMFRPVTKVHVAEGPMTAMHHTMEVLELQHAVIIPAGALLCCAVLYQAVLCCAACVMLSRALSCCAVLCNAALHCAVPCCSAVCNALLLRVVPAALVHTICNC